MQLHKRDVVAAAAAILDNYGIADLTMRRLARELDITPGALYWHFANKQQLLGAVADRLLHSVPGAVDADAPWGERVRAICTRMRDALRSHTDGAELVSASFAAGQSRGVIDILAALTGAAGEAGLDPERAEIAARTVIYYVLGFTADEQSRMQWGASESASETFTNVAAGDPDRRFAFGLRLLVDGLAVHGGMPVH